MKGEKTENRMFWIGVIIFIVMFFVFYPQFMSISDENIHLSMVNQLSQGKITVDDVFDSHMYFEKDGVFAPRYPIGNSVVLLPFSFFNWRFIFLSGLVLHLLNTFVLVKIFKKFNLNKMYALLYLLYPGYVFYSRTIMSEMPTITFTLLGFYLYLKADNGNKNENNKNMLYAGLMWGISCLIRPTNALVIVGAGIPMFYRAVKATLSRGKINIRKLLNNDNKKLIYLGLGVIPAFALTLLYNYYITGNIFELVYSNAGVNVGKALFGFSSLLIYWKPIVIMLLVYPLMLLSPFIMKYKKKAEILWIIVLFMIVLGKSNVIRYDLITNLVIGHRYFFTLIPLMLIPYSLFLKKYFKRLRILIVLCMVLLIIACPILMYKQDTYSDGKSEIMEQICDAVPENSVVVGYFWPDMFYLNNYFGNNYKILDMNNLKLSGYEGDYYLVHYNNKELQDIVTNEDDLMKLDESEVLFNELSLSNGFELFLDKGDLKVYYVG